MRKILLISILLTGCTKRIYTSDWKEIGERVDRHSCLTFSYCAGIMPEEPYFGFRNGDCPGTETVMVKVYQRTFHYENDPTIHLETTTDIIEVLEPCHV